MKGTVKTASMLFLKLIVINFLCMMIVVSVSVIANLFFADIVGYSAIGTKKGSEKAETLYTYRYEDGEDTKFKEYEAKGYEIVKQPMPELSQKNADISTAVAQIFSICLLTLVIYNNVWKIGTKDNNLVKFNHINEDTLKGFKIGFLTIIPFLILLIIFYIFKDTSFANIKISIFQFVYSCYYGLINLAVGNSKNLSDLSVLNFIYLFAIQLITPIICGISYVLGYKNISIGEKIIYKKN